MPADEIVPSREKGAVKARAKASLEASQPKQIEGQAVQPDGSPKGGMEGNTVMNRATGK
jgi:hypothetical protein